MGKSANNQNFSAIRVNPMRREGVEGLDEGDGTDVDGPVFFGDSDNGYCFSLTFR